MTLDQVGGLVRALLAWVGGYLVGKGYVGADVWQQVIAASPAIVAAAWSIANKAKAQSAAGTVKSIALVLAAGVAVALLGGCSQLQQVALKTQGIDPNAQVVTREQVQTTCELVLLSYAGWEAAGNPGVKDNPGLLKKIRAAEMGVETACSALPTTAQEALSAVLAGVHTFRSQLDALKAG